MKHIRNLSLAILISIFSSSFALAEYTMGISAGVANIEASGTETEGGEKNSKNVDHTTIIGSIFLEANNLGGTGFTLGIDYVPMTADVSDKVKKRTDTELSVTGTAKHTSLSRAQSAQAELNDHITLYAMQEVGDLYLKVGYVMVDLETTESLATGSKYGNVDLNGVLIGAGTEFEVGNNAIGRLEFSHTAYESLELQSSATRAGVSPNNLIEADLDVTQLKASIGYKF
tara:strand:- start:31 stop:717 length:687 start_codon:yes stop_codon:yes gene_type:complete